LLEKKTLQPGLRKGVAGGGFKPLEFDGNKLGSPKTGLPEGLEVTGKDIITSFSEGIYQINELK
jgi:hypothetical protein